MKAVIIGSGIAGLTAIALRKVGIQARIYERMPELREVGAVISLWCNALRALEYIGAAEAVRERSIPMTHSDLRINNGKVTLTRLDAKKMASALGVPELISMAIEDAVVIARHLSQHKRVPQSLHDFEGERFPRTQSIVTDSYRFGVLAQRQSWLGVQTRNWILRFLLITSGNRGILKYTNYDVSPLPIRQESLKTC